VRKGDGISLTAGVTQPSSGFISGKHDSRAVRSAAWNNKNQSFVYKAIPISSCGTLRSLLLAIRWKLYMIELIARANAMAVLEVELLSSRSQLESPKGLVHWFLLQSDGYDGLHGGTRTQKDTNTKRKKRVKEMNKQRNLSVKE